MRDNKILGKQLASVISDLAELRAQVVNMAEADTQNGLEVMKRMDRFESSFKQTHKTLRQEVTAEISGVKEKHSTLVGQVSDLAHALSLVEAAQASMRGCMDARHEVYQEMETRVKAMEREAGVVKKTHDPSEAAFFIAASTASEKRQVKTSRGMPTLCLSSDTCCSMFTWSSIFRGFSYSMCSPRRPGGQRGRQLSTCQLPTTKGRQLSASNPSWLDTGWRRC